MSQELINHSDDLKKLQNEGYELDVNNGYGIVSHIPYLKANGEIDYGMTVYKDTLDDRFTTNHLEYWVHMQKMLQQMTVGENLWFSPTIVYLFLYFLFYP